MAHEPPTDDLGYRFGSIVVDPGAKKVTRGGQTIPIGGRCFDLLLCMMEQPGVILSQAHIVKKVWPDVFVSDGNLRVQLSQLRKVLDEGTVVNVVGRGYVFTASPERIDLSRSAAQPDESQPQTAHLIGRSGEISKVGELVLANRLATIVGAGGFGKSALADSVSRHLTGHAIAKVDLSPASDGHSIATALMRALGGGTGRSINILGVDIPYEDDQNRIVVFDSCEHLPDVSEAVASLLHQTERVRVLCTSREPVRVPSEQLFRLSTLAVPPKDVVLPSEAVQYPSVELLATRARSVIPDFEIIHDNVRAAVDLSRRLDGIPLAIELAAGRLDSLGLDLLAERVTGYKGLEVGKNHGNAPRHRTLMATLDWSYGLLSGDEQKALRYVSVFSGEFTIEAAEFLLAPTFAEIEPIELIISLIDKSLVSADLSRRMPVYRLLDTTRAFARHLLLNDPDERMAAQRRHAVYISFALERVQPDWYSMPEDDWLNEYARHLDDMRAALDWTFSSRGDAGLGLAITASAPTLWFRMSLFKEARRRFEQAVDQLEKNQSGDPLRDFEVYAAMGASLNYTIGPGVEAGKSWDKALSIAEQLDRDDLRMRALWGIWLQNFSGLKMRESLDWARQLSEIAERSGEPADRITGHRLQAMTLTWLGEVDEATRHLDAITALGDPGRSVLVAVHFDHTLISDASRSVALWLQGAQDRAVRLSSDMIERASRSKHAMSLSLALVDCGCLVAYLSGERALLRDFIDRLRKVSTKQAFGPWEGWCRSYEGCLLMLDNRHQEAIARLQEGIQSVKRTRWMVLKGMFAAALAECLIAMGEPGAALQAIDEGLHDVRMTGEHWAFPELLRVKATALLAKGGARHEAKALLEEALDFATGRNLLSWQLRASIDLAGMLAGDGATEQATSLLSEVSNRFTEGHAQPDRRRAHALLDVISRTS